MIPKTNCILFVFLMGAERTNKTAGLFACIGAYRGEHVWLYPTISLVGSAAFFRSYAVLAHNSEPLVSTIVFEIVISVVLIFCVFLMKKNSEPKGEDNGLSGP